MMNRFLDQKESLYCVRAFHFHFLSLVVKCIVYECISFSSLFPFFALCLGSDGLVAKGVS